MEHVSPLIIRLNTLHQELAAELQIIKTIAEFEAIRNKFIGKQGSITIESKNIRSLSLEEKRTVGTIVQDIRKKIEELIEHAQQELITRLQQEVELQKQFFDVTTYNTDRLESSVHPYTRVIQDIEDTFISMGFEIINGIEVETEFANFEALNIPADHPARESQDTFWLNLPNKLLRTQTSNVQIHMLQERKPPFAITSMGRVYRNEATDATHDYMFMQCELMVVDTKQSLSNLFAITQELFRSIFKNNELTLRIRPGFFPFVEPGIEVDIQCPFCKSGCSICKRTTWIEAGGAGLVHPNVLDLCGVDKDKYSGCAFGFGLTRLVMLKYGINDVRLLHGCSLDFLKQF